MGVSLGAIWYLAMLLTIKLAAGVMDTIVHGNSYLCLLISFFLMICGMFLLNGINDIPWYISSACSALFFFFLGHVLQDKTSLFHYLTFNPFVLLLFSAVGLALLYVFVYISGPVNLGNNTYSTPILAPISAVVGIFFIVNISLLINANLSGRVCRLVKKLLTYLGINSLFIMGWHSEIRVVLYYVMNNFPDILRFVLVFILTIVICIPFSYISKRILP